MNINNGFFDALESLGEENSVETDLLIEKVKSAMLKAARKAYPHTITRLTKTKLTSMLQELLTLMPI